MSTHHLQPWPRASIVFHWSTVLLVLATLALGLYMTELPNSANKMRLYALHKSLGLTVLGLTVLRLAHRWFVRAPDNAPNNPPLLRLAARITHVALYLLLLIVPLLGWLMNSAAGFPLKWFQWIKVPALVHADPGMKVWAADAHWFSANLLLVLVLVHALAALKHHHVNRDHTLRGMLAWKRKPEN
jgi:cytochrome b561